MDSLHIGNVVEVLGQVTNPATEWTWHHIRSGLTEGYVRSDTLVMMTEQEYEQYLTVTAAPILTYTPAPVSALTAQPRATWAGTHVPDSWVSSPSSDPTASPEPVIANEVPTTTVPAAATELPVLETVAPDNVPDNNLLIILILVGVVICVIGIGIIISLHKRNRYIQEQIETAERVRDLQRESDQWMARGADLKMSNRNKADHPQD